MKLQSALDMAARGFKVFPLVANTKLPPKDFPWKQNATTDEATIRGWWGEDPDYNIGVATGFGTLVVDADMKDGKPGLDSLALLDMLGLPGSLRVTTPSGGVHVYMRATGDHSNRVDSIPDYPGIDIRTDGGYVLAPGSTVKGKPYAAVDMGTPISQAPSWFEEHLQRTATEHRMSASEQPLVELDLPEHVAKATAWLHDSAQDAVEGAGGDQSTYEVACRLRDLGISEPLALELMLEHWNETKASPPWQPDELATKVANAYRYSTGGWGAGTAAGEFGVVDIDIGEAPAAVRPVAVRPVALADGKPKPEDLAPGRFTLDDLAAIRPREWLYGYKLQRKYVGFLASPGGVGKSAWVFAAALAMASGRKLLHDQPHRPLKVWVFNLEDDAEEMKRRVVAALQHFELPAETLDNLYFNSGRDRGFKILAMKDDQFVVQPDARRVVEIMRAEGIDVLIVDPYLRSHSVPENANEAQDAVMALYAQIADRANGAVLLVHHVKKGAIAGDMDSLRGGSTQGGGARSVYTMAPMSADEADVLGIPENERRLHVRIDDAKNNMAPPTTVAEWIRLQSVSLANGTDEYPVGDSVQVATRWVVPGPMEGVETDSMALAVDRIEAGPGDGERFSIRPQDAERWAGKVLMDVAGRSRQQAKAILDLWLKSDAIAVEEYRSPAQRKARQGVFVNREKMPDICVEEME